MFASHHWPRWGNERIQEVLRGQRDLYAHMNNQVLHLANQGVTINEIHNVYEVPKSLHSTAARSYHGNADNSRPSTAFLATGNSQPDPLSPKIRRRCTSK
jgi:alkyl sulfatase BDS1-like metallo-beta-lactamase superfamily hydrolase